MVPVFDFCDEVPVCNFIFESRKFSPKDKETISSKDDKLLHKNVIVPCEKAIDGFISPTFYPPLKGWNF